MQEAGESKAGGGFVLYPSDSEGVRAPSGLGGDAPEACPQCGSIRLQKAGTRKLKRGGQRQMYRCSDCFHRFSSRNRSGKNTHPEAILEALCLICQGVPYDVIIEKLRLQYRVVRTKSAISRWATDFPLPWREMLASVRVANPLVRGYLFTHAGLRYHYRLHRGKLLLSKRHAGLVRYLEQLPGFLKPEIFDNALHCSQLSHLKNPGARHCRETQLTELAGRALTLSPSNQRRHTTLQTYFLYCDRNTVATEVPVYMRDPDLGLVAGHIDFVQVQGDKILLLDYKPKAAGQLPDKVVTQLSLYALALSRRTGLSLGSMQCGWFDDRDVFYFDPWRVSK
jgi:transposase-like protein